VSATGTAIFLFLSRIYVVTQSLAYEVYASLFVPNIFAKLIEKSLEGGVLRR